VESVSFSPDGCFALTEGVVDWTLRLWELSSGKCLRTFEGRTKGMSWSPDGRFALSGSNNTLRLWEISSGKFLRTFEGHTSWVTSVSFNPDGRFALSGSHDLTLRLWEVSSGKCLRTFEGHTREVTSVSWGPDGRCALSGSEDKTLRLWELDWEFEPTEPADWEEGARPFLNAFLTIHTPYVDGLVRQGKPSWTEDDFRRLLDKLGCAGYGWLRPEGVRCELDKMAAIWQGPPPLVP
jgi:WD40 repeat protein